MFARLCREGPPPCALSGESPPASRAIHRNLPLGPTFTALLAAFLLCATARADMVERRVATSTDDAEEAASGSMYLTSTDLELVFDTSNQTVGMRWTNLLIPTGSTITAAWIQFTAEETRSETTSVVIRGVAADNAATYGTTSGNISTRPRTAASVPWIPAAWTVSQAGPAQRTPELKAVFQEIVNRGGWAYGNALALVVTGTGRRNAWSFNGNANAAPLLHVEFTAAAPPTAMLTVSQLASPPLTARADGSASVAGSGGPIASYRFDFGDGSAPVTTTAPTAVAQHSYAAAGTYTVTLIATDTGGNASTPATRSIVVQSNSAPVARISVSQLATPALTVRANGSASTDTDYAPIASYRFDFGDGSAAVTTTAPTAVAQHGYAAPGNYTVTLTATDAGGLTSTPATQTITVQADNPPVARVTAQQISSPAFTVVADGATSTDSDLTPVASYRFDFGDGTAPVTVNAPTTTTQHTYAGAGTYTVSLIATDTGGLVSAAVTTSVTVSPPAGGTSTVEKRVASSADDVEQSASGSMVLTSSDLELVFDQSNQVVGMRWTGLAIPQGAAITAAYVQFVADEAQSEATNLTVAGQAADNAAAFTTASNNVSSRARTAATVAWAPAAWTAGQVTFTQRTPDLAAVIREIVGRPGWASGNALVLIITGTGHRTAVAYDGSAAQAPLLHVEYSLVTGPTARLSLTPSTTTPYTVTADGSASTAAAGSVVASYRFDFGDGTAAVTTTAPTASAAHTYANAGTYTVSLAVTDDAGRISSPATSSVTLTPEGPPTAALAVSQPIDPPFCGRADGSASTDNDMSPIASYSFDFGDGTAPVTTQAPQAVATHVYAAAGTYTVRLIATDTAGRNSTPATASLVIQTNSPPVARLTVSQPAIPPLTARADGSTSSDTDFAPIASYRFDFGDGTAAVVTNAPNAIATHAYAAAGTYTVTLTATDAAGLVSPPATRSITVVPDDPPVARLSLTQLPNPQLTVRADASASTDSDLTPIASYRFDFGDGSEPVITNSPTTLAYHTYTSAGNYTVSLTATDTGGQSSSAATASINVVRDDPPVAQLSVTQLATPALTVRADASGSTDTDVTPIASYRFDFGDGTAPVTTTAPTAAAQHTYAVSGNFTVTVTATDAGGYVSPPRSATIAVLGAISAERRISASSDDAEQRSSSSISLTSSSLQLVVDGSYVQVVGLRWPSITIPRNAQISSAWIQFTASSAQSGTMNLTIAGQAADNAATFTSSSNNVSSRTRTAATVAWTPAAWTSGQAGSAQRTPELRNVIQEIVNRTGWASGNAIAMIVTGSGTRTAHSWDSNSSLAAVLHIDYLGVGTAPTARVTAAQIGSPPLTVRADGATSTAGDSPIASYRFDFGDGSAPVTVNAPTTAANHAYTTTGTYTVTLIATDTGGRSSTPATTNVTVSQSSSGPIAVYVGYYDTHHPDVLRTKPSPWYGSPGITFVGTPDSGSGGWDSSGIRIVNQSAASISLTVTVDMGSSHFALWGSRTVAAGGTLVLAQTGFENFDGSDTNPAGCYGCNPNLCNTQVQSTVPVVHVTMNGTTTNYYDTGQITNTHGVDMAGCPYTGTRNDESNEWVQIFTQAPAQMMTREEALRAGYDASLAQSYRLWFGEVTPNPVGAQLALHYEIPARDNVKISIYDVAGRLVQTHLDREIEAGQYVGHVNLSSVPSGMYYCTLKTGGRTLHQRFVHVQ